MRQTVNGVRRSIRLAWDLAHRDIIARYGQSMGGLTWLVVTPVSFAATYWMVFGYFLQLKWLNPATGAEVPYIAPLFAGLATYLLLADTIMASLTTFRQKREYVRRAAVPLWVLWLATILRVALCSAANFLVLAVLALVTGLMSWRTIAMIPFAIVVVMASAMAISLVLSLLGAFFSDLDEISRIALRVAFYTSPITYPLSIVPDRFVAYLWVNPMTVLAEVVRDAFVFGISPGPLPYIVMLAVSMALLGLGAWLYSRLKGPIVDVV